MYDEFHVIFEFTIGKTLEGPRCWHTTSGQRTIPRLPRTARNSFSTRCSDLLGGAVDPALAAEETDTAG
ncbi:MAG: hypothetical protein QOG21_325 [Actinomycetota bacterium]|nr:hypothetical protein [Actinomycetota bacterium]